jgi:hypothetical protein
MRLTAVMPIPKDKVNWADLTACVAASRDFQRLHISLERIRWCTGIVVVV